MRIWHPVRPPSMPQKPSGGSPVIPWFRQCRICGRTIILRDICVECRRRLAEQEKGKGVK